jgi:hypothetical protein
MICNKGSTRESPVIGYWNRGQRARPHLAMKNSRLGIFDQSDELP